MRIVITGGNSFIGQRLAKRAGMLGWETLLVARPSRRVVLPPNATLIETIADWASWQVHAIAFFIWPGMERGESLG